MESNSELDIAELSVCDEVAIALVIKLDVSMDVTNAVDVSTVTTVRPDISTDVPTTLKVGIIAVVVELAITLKDSDTSDILNISEEGEEYSDCGTEVTTTSLLVPIAVNVTTDVSLSRLDWRSEVAGVCILDTGIVVGISMLVDKMAVLIGTDTTVLTIVDNDSPDEDRNRDVSLKGICVVNTLDDDSISVANGLDKEVIISLELNTGTKSVVLPAADIERELNPAEETDSNGVIELDDSGIPDCVETKLWEGTVIETSLGELGIG